MNARPVGHLALALYLLLLLTGATGLLYEVVLGRLLTLHVGSSGAAQAVVLATFLGGLSLGAHGTDRFFAQRLRGPRQALAAWAGLEAFIGLWAAGVAHVADAVFAALVPLAATLPAGSAGDVALSMCGAAACALPLATAMGATLPVLALALGPLAESDGPRWVSRCYAINAGGGALGAWLAGFWAIEALGLRQPLWIGAAINLAVAAAGLLLARQQPPTESPTAAQSAGVAGVDVGAAGAPWTLRLAAFATGVVTLVDEVVWVRLAALLLGASAYSFAFMLVVVIVGISVGAALANAFLGRGVTGAKVLAFGQVAAAVATVGLAYRLAALPEDLLQVRLALPATPDHYATWLWRGGGLFALHLLPAAIALGASFPALLAAARDAGASVGRATGQLLGANTLGNLVGALAGGFLLMPTLGLERVLLVGGAASFAVAAAVSRPRRGGQRAALAALGAIVLAIAFVAPPSVGLLYHGLVRFRADEGKPPPSRALIDPGERWVFREDGKDASITVDVLRRGDGFGLTFATNGKADGSSAESLTQVGLGLVGLPMAPHASDALVIGLGTGQSAAAAAAIGDLRVRVVELSPSVLSVAALFTDINADLLHHPAVTIDIADARTTLQRMPPGSFDLIVSQPSNPWVVGVPDLYTVETFDLVRRALRPGGALVQWLQAYEMSDATFRSVLCTVAGSFASVRVFRLEAGDLALVSATEPRDPDLDRAARRMRSPALQRLMEGLPDRRLPRDLDALLVHELAGPDRVRHFCQGFDEPLRLFTPRLEYQAPRDFFAALAPARSLKRLDARFDPSDKDLLLPKRWRTRAPTAEQRAQVANHLQRSASANDAAVVAALRGGVDLPEDVSALVRSATAVHDANPQPDPTVCRRIASRVPGFPAQLRTIYGQINADARLLRLAAACQAADVR